MSLNEKSIDPLPSREQILGISTSLVTDRGSDRALWQGAIAHYVPTCAFELVHYFVHLAFESGGDRVLRVPTKRIGMVSVAA
ncbi:MAG: hypothetical protein ACYCU8_13095 [Ferrimicrobium acidiphilum]